MLSSLYVESMQIDVSRTSWKHESAVLNNSYPSIQ